ncbi:DUF362 domain-containing protein [Methanocella sp. MCL-LM]|uniref:DUF362 domain-containing protein n=1 Tax=Methanocella sp. MCL-LM TaxID=3412035 RepID=UPI003C7178E2
MTYEVSVKKCEDYEDEKVRAAIEESLKPLGGLESVVKKGDRVLLKLNLLSSKKPEDATTTHPAMVKAVVRMVQEIGGIPVLGDSPGGRNTPGSIKALMKNTGMQAVADETGCGIVSFEDETVEATSDAARTYKKFTIAKAVRDADVIIALPKLKTHQLTYYTGAVKLLYGYIPGIMKTEYHLHTGRDVMLFAELLLDLHEMRRPDLVIMDAVVGMEGRGPSAGNPRQIGLVLASKSCTALDFLATYIVGMDPLAVPTVKRAADRNLGPGSLDEIVVRGEDPATVRVKDFKLAATMDMSRVPAPLLNLASRLVATKPVIDAQRCRKCGVCARDCPPKAMFFSGGRMPKIDYRKCIRCYCCQELCPERAVSVKVPVARKVLGRLLGRPEVH